MAYYIVFTVVNFLAMLVFFLVLRARFSQRRILSELRAEMDRLIADLGREADRDVAILESRVKNLRSLIDEADKRIILASKETRRRDEASQILAAIADRPPTVPETQPKRQQASPAEPVRIYTKPILARGDRQIEPFVPVQERVVDLSRKGFTAEMISSTLSVPLGEVELILNMNGSSL